MSSLASCLEEYLSLRRSLGYKLQRAPQVLADFVGYMEAHGAGHITVPLALDWAVQPEAASPGWRASRLGAVRCFARYAQALDPAHEVPPVWLLPAGRHRPAPYIYSEAEVVALMKASSRLPTPLRAVTLETVTGLLAVSGTRVGEVVRLDRDDIRVHELNLYLRSSKGGKSRVVPVRPSTARALEAYAVHRDELCPSLSSMAMFVSRRGTRLATSDLGMAFAEVLKRAGVPERAREKRPRLADLRHTFAVRTLTSWHEQGLDVEALLPLLSTVMGHISPASTYWYLQQCPELLGAAARRLERTRGGRR